MFGRPETGTAGFANAGEASTAAGSDGFRTSGGAVSEAAAVELETAGATGAIFNVNCGPGDANAGALAGADVGAAMLAGAVIAEDAAGGVALPAEGAVRGFSLNLPGSSAAGAGTGFEEMGAGTRSGGNGAGVIDGSGAGTGCAGSGDAGRGAWTRVGAGAESAGFSVEVTACPELKRGLRRRGSGDWGSLLIV